MNRREFLALTAVAVKAGQAGSRLPGWMARKWTIDSRCVLPRGQSGAFDSKIAGDPVVVWDEEVRTWRMFYFASSEGDPAKSGPSGPLVAGMALSRSAEEIGPGDWEKAGQVPLHNPEALLQGKPGHKWWVVLDPQDNNRAARIGGRYWALFVSTYGVKHIQAASAERLAGPWTVVVAPILSPGAAGAPDSKHCDTPTAYWFESSKQMLIFYKAYPLRAQAGQPGSPFGSSSVMAHWSPGQATAVKGRQILIPGRDKAWNRGWVGGVQLLHDEQTGWYALSNGSPTPPEDQSNREPAPSVAGWLRCQGGTPEGEWSTDLEASPFRYPDQLTEPELRAGLGVNFWRHHLLVTPGGRARIFFNSGKYGTEQMYSLVPQS
jgi:hypothetical protein